MASAAKLFVEIEGRSQGFANAMNDVENRIQGVGRKMQSVGRNISAAGRTMTAAVTLPIVAGAALATKAAIDWETAWTGVLKTVEATPQQLAAIERGLRDMSKEIPTSAEDLAGIAEIAGQLGIAPENILKFTRTIADLQETTNLLGEEGALALAQLINIMGTSQGDIDRMGAAIVELGNNTSTTEADIVAMSQRVAAAGAVVGLAESDVLALSAAMASVGIRSEAGGTAMSRILADMASAAAGMDPANLERLADVAGVTSDEFARLFQVDPAQALLAFVRGLGEVENKFQVLEDLGFGDIRVRDTLLRLAEAENASASLTDALELGARAWDENIALQEEAALRYGTTAAKLGILRNRAQDVLRTVGGPLVDAMIEALEAAEPFFKMIGSGAAAFAEMPTGMQRTILAAAGLLAAIGPVLFVIGKLVTVIGGLISFFGSLAGVLAGASAAFGSVSGAVGAVLAFLTGPIGLAIGAVVLAIAGLALAWRNNWFDIQGITGKAISGVVGLWQNKLLPAIQAVGGWIQTNLFPILDALAHRWLAGVRLELALLGTAFRVWWGVVTTVANVVRNTLGGALRFVIGLLARFGINMDTVIQKIQAATIWIQGLATRFNNIQLPAFLRGGGGTATGTTGGTSGGGGASGSFGGPSIGPRRFPTVVAPRAEGGQTVSFNAPLINVQGDVRNEDDVENIKEAMRQELQNTLLQSIGQNTRPPIGVGQGVR